MVTDYIGMARDNMDSQGYENAPYDFFFTALEVFGTRNLSMDNDAVNAMRGIIN